MSAVQSLRSTTPVPRRAGWPRILRRPLAVGALLVIVAFVVVGTFAPWIAPQTAAATDFNALLAPPSWHHLLGTDELGRDEFSRLVWGARASIQAGVFATLLALLIAVPLGLVAGYFGGWLDAMIARGTDVMLSFPFVILAIGLGAILGPSLETATIALGVAAAPGMIRIVRGEALSLRNADFVPAAVAVGAGDTWIIARHILPNMTSTLLVQATLLVPRAIIGEATLSFLGLGVRVPGASWGLMLQDAQSYLTQAPRLAVYPGVSIALAVFAFNFVGDELRDLLDPRISASC